LYNYRARLYDSDLGRFLTPDPKHQFPSPYVYVNNNPLSFTDPTGEMLLRMARTPGRFRRAGGSSRAFSIKNVKGKQVWIFDSVEEAKTIMAKDSRFKNRTFVAKEVPHVSDEIRNAPAVSEAEAEKLAWPDHL